MQEPCFLLFQCGVRYIQVVVSNNLDSLYKYFKKRDNCTLSGGHTSLKGTAPTAATLGDPL